MKRFVEGEDRAQGTLLPEHLDDYVAEDNPVRVVDAFIEHLDLRKLGFESVDRSFNGRPAYHPAVLLKIYILPGGTCQWLCVTMLHEFTVEAGVLESSALSGVGGLIQTAVGSAGGVGRRPLKRFELVRKAVFRGPCLSARAACAWP